MDSDRISYRACRYLPCQGVPMVLSNDNDRLLSCAGTDFHGPRLCCLKFLELGKEDAQIGAELVGLQLIDVLAVSLIV
jgi:hypothetical protein